MIAASCNMFVFPAREKAYSGVLSASRSQDEASAGDPMIRNDKPYLPFSVVINRDSLSAGQMRRGFVAPGEIIAYVFKGGGTNPAINLLNSAVSLAVATSIILSIGSSTERPFFILILAKPALPINLV